MHIIILSFDSYRYYNSEYVKYWDTNCITYMINVHELYINIRIQ